MLQPVVYQFMYHVIICHSLLFTRSGTTLEWCVNAVMVQPVVYGVKDHIRVVLSQPVQVRNHVKVVNVHQARDHVAVVVYQNHYVRAICLPGQGTLCCRQADLRGSIPSFTVCLRLVTL